MVPSTSGGPSSGTVLYLILNPVSDPPKIKEIIIYVNGAGIK